MTRYILIGVLLFAVFGVAFAPAGLLDRILEQNTPADLADTRGTLWRGQGQLLVNNRNMGLVSWKFAPLSLLRAAPAYDWTLRADDWQLDGSVATGFSGLRGHVSGPLSVTAVNQWLRLYDIYLTGDFEIAPTQISADPASRAITSLDGQINWSGGLVRYTLSGIVRETTLPPLTAYLRMRDTATPEAVVFAEGQQTPLLMASLAPDGFARVSITKLFTTMLNNPWPGSDPDHAVVMELEEQVF